MSLRISRVILRRCHSCPEILRAQHLSKIPKNNSRGILFWKYFRVRGRGFGRGVIFREDKTAFFLPRLCCWKRTRAHMVFQSLNDPIWGMAGWRESSRTRSEPPLLYEISFPCEIRAGGRSSYEPAGSDVVRKLSCEPAMFQIGL